MAVKTFKKYINEGFCTQSAFVIAIASIEPFPDKHGEISDLLKAYDKELENKVVNLRREMYNLKDEIDQLVNREV